MKKMNLLLGGCALLSLQACAFLTPYEIGKGNDDHKGIYVGICKFNAANPSGCVPIEDAAKRARYLRLEYLEAAGQDELARKIAGSGITLAASYALLLGISDGIGPANASDQIMAIGAGTAAAFGLTSIFTSPTRQKIFVAGARAVTCVEQASTPFQFDSATLKKLHDLLVGSGGASGQLESDIAAVEAGIELLALTYPDDRRVSEYVAGLRREIEAARAAVGRGHAVIQEATEIAPSRLIGQLGVIQTAVASQLQATTIDMNSILQVISNLKASASNIAPQYGKPPAAQPGTGVQQKLFKLSGTAVLAITPDSASSLSSMRSGTSFINVRADDLERRIQGVGRSFETCNFEQVTLGIRLLADKIEVKRGGSNTFSVAEGDGPFAAEISGSPAGLTVEFVPAFGNRGIVTATAAVAAQDYQISIYDRTMKPVLLTVTVK